MTSQSNMSDSQTSPADEEAKLSHNEDTTSEQQLVSLADSVPDETEEILKQTPPSPPQTQGSSCSSLSYKIINSDDSNTTRNSLGSPKQDFCFEDLTQSAMARKAVVEPERQVYNSTEKVRYP